MKKFLVILLSLAVLFGFAACDNSSSTPDDGDTTTTEVSYETYKAMADALADDLAAALTAGFDDDASIVAGGEAASGYAFDGTSFTYTRSALGATERENETYSLTLNGVLLEGTGTTGRTIQLTDYEYTFSKPLNTTTTPYDFTTTTGSASGYLDGTLEVTLDTDNSLLTVDVPSTSNIKMFLPDAESKVSLYYGESEVTAKADVISIMNFGVADSDNPTSYAAWRTAQTDDYEDEIGTLVTALISDSNSNIFTVAATDTATATRKDYVTTTYTAGTNGGELEITYALAEDAADEVVIAGNGSTTTNDATVIKLGKGDSLTLSLTSKAGDATNTFTVDSYTLSGTFKVYKYSTADTALVAYDVIDEFNVEGLTGAVSGLTANRLDASQNANAYVSGTAASQTATDGDAWAMIAVGPARDAEGAIIPERVEYSAN